MQASLHRNSDREVIRGKLASVDLRVNGRMDAAVPPTV